MKIVFFSNFLNHHQVPVADELYQLTDGNYFFIETEPVPESFIRSGYPIYEKKYCVKTWKSDLEKKLALSLALEADVAIFSPSCAIKYAKERLKLGKLTFGVSERWLKKGVLNLLSYNLWKHQIFYYKYGTNAPYYMLCSSAFAAKDYNILCSFKKRCYKWGYFPEFKKFDIEKSLELKRGQKNYILWCARLIEWKHPEFVIKIAKKLKADNYDFEINMYGSGPLKEDIEKMIVKYSLHGYVTLRGNISNSGIIDQMQNHHIFLFTSDRNEGWGAVANEAMSNGCTILASDEIGSVPYLIKDGFNGLTFKSLNVSDCYTKLLELINNRMQCEVMARNAYQSIKEKWSPKVAANNLINLSRALISNTPNPITDGPCSQDF